MAVFKSVLSLVALYIMIADAVAQPSPQGGIEGKAIRGHSLRHVGFPKFPVFGTGPHKREPSSTCGQRHVIHAPPNNSPNEPLMKVVGGAPAPYGAYPWTVHIESLSYEGFEHGCGGTLVSELFVITAAHCLHGYGSHEIRVKVGDYDSSKQDVAERIFEVEGWRVHPDFQKGGIYANDIAVLKIKPHLGRGVVFDEFVSPACLPSKDKIYPPGTWCLVSGWGLTHPDDFLPSDVLRAASVPLLPQSVCRRKDILGDANFRDGMICAGYLQGQIDACNGDSGGPLVCEMNGQHTLLGVVSWGMECAKKKKPGIYSEVQYYLDFITTGMDQL